jgi:hypothetical protein
VLFGQVWHTLAHHCRVAAVVILTVNEVEQSVSEFLKSLLAGSPAVVTEFTFSWR